jgi:hypothetical protein
VAGLGLTKTGYGFVVTRSGGLIGHPYVDASRGIYTTTTLAASGNTTVGGTLTVTGATTTNGITNTGAISTTVASAASVFDDAAQTNCTDFLRPLAGGGVADLTEWSPATSKYASFSDRCHWAVFPGL